MGISAKSQQVKYKHLFYYDHSIKTPSYFEKGYIYDEGESYHIDDNYIYIKNGGENLGLNHMHGFLNIVVPINQISFEVQSLIKQKYNKELDYTENVTIQQNSFYENKIKYYDERLSEFTEEERKAYEDSVIFKIYICEPISKDSVRLKEAMLYNTKYSHMGY